MKTIDEYPENKGGDLNTPYTNKELDILCNRVSNGPKIRFCCMVDSQGRSVASGFNDNIQPLNNEDQRQMLCAASRLELSTKREFNDTLGNVNFITTYRDNVALIIIPMQQDYLLLMSVERNGMIEQIVKNTISLFESNGILSGRDESISLIDNSTTPSECV
ncbi:MAG TPA: DUF6659 family protein [Nitrosopumilaceae archaeon]|jgi:hypothetical protein|nr:DUF6659 family protein [Nitrosopumilaceae archaeon]